MQGLGWCSPLVFGLANAADAAAQEPGVLVVVFTGLALVFAILIILWLVLMLEGKLFESLDKKKQEKTTAQTTAAPVQPPPAAPGPAPVPVVQEGIPPEVVAAIAGAVAQIEGGKYTLRSVQTTQKGRGQWGLAGVISTTEPF